MERPVPELQDLKRPPTDDVHSHQPATASSFEPIVTMRWSSIFQAAVLAGAANAAPAEVPAGTKTISKRQSTSRYVFAHFMMGIITDRTSSADYDADMQKAKALGIDAFALNVAPDTSVNYTQQLVYAYDSAASNDMKVFISFDFNSGYWSTSDPAAVGARIAAFGSHSAQLKVDDKAFVSSFVGDGLDVTAMKDAAGIDVFFAPNFNPGSTADDFTLIDGLFSWYAWPTDGSNNPPSASSTYLPTNADTDYTNKIGDVSKYVAPVSPWFFTHFQDTDSFAGKNWLYPADDLWFTRWNEILALGSRFVEIVTWNDYGESHYIGPLSSKHYDDGNSKWTNDMPHGGWADIAAPFIAAYKAGATAVTADHVTATGGEKVVYWFRPQPKGLDCASTDNVGSAPDGSDLVADSVFVVTLLTSEATLTVTSGSNAAQTFTAAPGANIFEVPMATGTQSFKVTRDDGATVVFSGDAPKQVSSTCVCGIYNFNAFVGMLPAGAVDSLDTDGLSRFTEGLKVSTCSPTPTLTANAKRGVAEARVTAV
ncbi:glycosyl hydrolase family 71-domain-containing protein [Phyllosticta citribraziliensis]